MACDRLTFEARFPEFTTETLDKYFDSAVNDYECYYSNSCLGETCDELAVCMAVAHLISIDDSSGSSSLKDKASQSVDGVSVTYLSNSNPSASENDLFWGSTKYGQRFLQITRPCGMGAVFV